MDGGCFGTGRRLPLAAVDVGNGPLSGDLRAARERLCAGLRGKGLELFISDDWAALEAVNAANREGWFPLLPRPISAPSFWIGAADARGTVIATHGVVMLDCAAASFGAKLAELTAFHDPGVAPADEWCFCASEGAHDTHGTVAWIVAGWNRLDWRGLGLFHELGAAARLVGIARILDEDGPASR